MSLTNIDSDSKLGKLIKEVAAKMKGNFASDCMELTFLCFEIDKIKSQLEDANGVIEYYADNSETEHYLGDVARDYVEKYGSD